MKDTRALLTAVVLLLALALPAAAPAPAAAQTCTQLLADGGFEGGGAWQLGPSAVTPQYQTYTVHGGSRALAMGITTGGNVKSYSSARQAVTIPGTTAQALLTFWFYAIAEAPATTDYMELVILDPAGNILGKPWWSHNDSRVWNQMTVDLTAWRGQTVQIYFNVYNDGLGGKAAMFLDDVSLTACSSPLTPGPGPGPTWTWTPPVVLPTWTPTSTPVPSCVDLLRNGSFSAGLSDWEPQGDPAGVAVVPNPARTAPYSLKLGSLEANLNGLATVRQPVTIPAGYSQVTLEAWVYTQTQSLAGADYQEIALLNSMGGLLLVPWRQQQDVQAWTRVAFDLTGFAGQTIYVRFGVNNDGGGGRTAMYVDDARLTACSGFPNPTWTPTWTPLPAPTWTPTPIYYPPPTWTPTSIYYPPPTWTPTSVYYPPPPGCVDLVQNPGFELGLYPWQPGKNLLPAQVVGSPVATGARALQLGTTSVNRNSYSSIRQWVTVPSGYPQVVVSFYDYTYSQAFGGGDEQKFVVLGPGDKVLAVPWKVLEDNQSWEQQVFDLSGLGTNTFALYFAAINDGAGGVTALYIDEVHLWACTPGSAPPVYAAPPDAAYTYKGAEAAPEQPVLPADATITGELPPELQGLGLATAMPAPTDLVLEPEPEFQVEEADILTPPPVWTEVAVDELPPATAGLVPTLPPGTPEAGAPGVVEVIPDDTPRAVFEQDILATPRIGVNVNLVATPQPGVLSRITSTWPRGWPIALLAIIVVVVLALLIRRPR